MVPLDSDAVWSDADDRLSILEIYQMEHEHCPGIPSRRPLDPGRIRGALQRHNHLLARLFCDEHRRDIRCGTRADQCAFKVSLSKMVGDTHWSFDVLIGAGPDADYCTGWPPRLPFIFKVNACEGIHQRSL